MSKTKFVEYGNRGLRAHGVIPLGFWAYDVALNVFLKYLIDAAEASDQANTEWLSTAIADWRLACVPDYGLTLDANWSTEQRQAFLALAEEACTRLAERESIPAEEIVSWPILDDIRIFTRGATEVFTAPVIELGHAIIALVRGDCQKPQKARFGFMAHPKAA